MTSLFYPLSLHLLLSIFHFLPAAANNSTYPKCPSYMCGDVNISYPFWRIDSESTTQYCGYEGFGINCSTIGDRSIPEISLGSDSFYVQRILQEYRIVILADRDVSFLPPGPNSCPRLQHGIDLETLPLKFTRSNANLSFHYNCTGCPSLATEIRIPCLERNQRKSCVHVMSSTTEELDWNDYLCSDQVMTTVSTSEYMPSIFHDISTKLGEILNRGFELEWWRMDDCEKCEGSGGRCGHHNKTGFICFCSDGTASTDDCKGKLIPLRIYIFNTTFYLLMIFILLSQALPLWSDDSISDP